MIEHLAKRSTEQSQGPNKSLFNIPALLGDIRGLIESAREQTARAVNSTLVVVYWQIGQRIRTVVLHDERAEYGTEIVQTLSAQLTEEYGRGFDRRNHFQPLRFAERLPQLVFFGLPGVDRVITWRAAGSACKLTQVA